MKSKLFILVLLLNNVLTAFACASFGDAPRDLRYYRVSEQHKPPYFMQPNYTQDNLLSWQKQAKHSDGYEYPLEDIHKVVYRYTIDEMKALIEKSKLPADDRYNGFAVWFTQRPRYANVLLIAKQVEKLRSDYQDPWYYPSEKGEELLTYEMLLKLIEQEEAWYTIDSDDSRFYLHRYMLQRIRVLFSMGRYVECIALWENKISLWPDNDLMRRMIKDYIAGAYAHAGNIALAQQMYLEQGNLWALVDLTQSNTRGYAGMIRAVYDIQPDCAEIVAPALQSELEFVNQNYYTQEKDIAKCKQYYELMQYVIRTHRSKDMAIWYYTAAFLEDQLGNSKQAAQTIRKAAQCKTSDYMQTNIRYMRIYLEAKTRTYDAAYEQQLLTDLKWIDKQVRQNIGDIKGDWDTYSSWQIFNNLSNSMCAEDTYSIYYPNNLLRKIVLSVVAPRMKAAGKTSLSIALTNYADNLIFTLIEPETRHCFFNNFFMALDTIPAATAEQYVMRALNPSTPMERFLATGSYIDKDYLCDIVGTLYIREEKYKKAMECLSRVTPTYQFRLNTNYNLCAHDPFGVSTDAYKPRQVVDSKYNFASHMYALEQIFENVQVDPNRRADALLSYAIGYQNSFIRVWGLTQYGKGRPVFTYAYEPWLTAERQKRIVAHSKRLRNEAYSLYTNDEASAAAHLRCFNNFTVVTKYPNSAAAEYIRSHCDTYYDYHPEYNKQ